ncbi:MAG: hypothetical protein IJT27_09520 [Clostridia bacterium]|nr:hypothetical protein [Clostridia bacterium]
MTFTKKENCNEVLLQNGYCYSGPDESGDRVHYYRDEDGECNKNPYGDGWFGDWYKFVS